MSTKNCRYHLPYVEHVKRTGEQLRKNLDKIGIDWWPTEEYLPLPTYFPNVIEDVSDEYNFYVTRCTAMQFYRATNVSHPWLLESAEHIRGQGKIVMNADAAKNMDIKDDDEIWVESPENRIKSRVKLVQGIRPDTLVIAANLGHWTTPGIKDKHWVTLNSLIPLKYNWTDPLTGAIQAHVIKAKVYKA
jgi:anaerobic selenocysteine-containing dehydrogenase